MSTAALGVLDLPWLPRTAEDFKARLSAAGEDPAADWGPALVQLATQYLGLNQALALAKRRKALHARAPSRTLVPFKLGLVSNGTLDFVVPMLEATALRYGIALEIVAADFGQQVQEAMDPGSRLNSARPDAVLLALDHHGLPFASGSGEADADAALQHLFALCDGFRAHGGTACLVQTVPTPLAPRFGSLDAAQAGTQRRAVAAFNAALAASAPSRGDIVVDIEALAQTAGLERWLDDRAWHMARLPFAQAALPAYAEWVVRVIAAMRGRSRKCLVLDLDNTLWGGVIGDDGLEGIALAQGDARGEAHRAVQAAALDLRRRGIVLAVCSKNDEANARLPFREHPDMLLREDDIAVFTANWNDKASNLEQIARRLDIGIDALVLLDDNPAERAQVRQALPQVAVPELGSDASGYVRLLTLAGYFESVAFTTDDLARADQYRGNADRAALQETSRDLGEFLRSLEMTIRFAPFDAQGRKRIAQLINKTNQFNLTTRRYTEAQVQAMETDARRYTLQVGLVDRFGDNGMIGVVVCDREADAWRIDSWLMSCRVLNRRVEQAVCNRLAGAARAAGARRLVGSYVPSARNGMVADLLPRLGFEADGSDGEVRHYVLDLDRFVAHDVPMTEATE